MKHALSKLFEAWVLDSKRITSIDEQSGKTGAESELLIDLTKQQQPSVTRARWGIARRVDNALGWNPNRIWGIQSVVVMRASLVVNKLANAHDGTEIPAQQRKMIPANIQQ